MTSKHTDRKVVTILEQELCIEKGKDWSDDKARRRNWLVDREIHGTILEDEKTELDGLQKEMLAHRRKVAPLDDLRKTHQDMLQDAIRRTDNHSGAISLLKEWIDEFYFENNEGRYIECKMCGADDSETCGDDCLSRRTKVFLAKIQSDDDQCRSAEIERLRKALAEIMKPDFIDKWLDTPTAALGGMKPIEVVERGEASRVWDILYRLRSGEPT